MENCDLEKFDNVLEYICLELQKSLKIMPLEYKTKVEEIRLRNSCPLIISFEGQDYFINAQGKLTKDYGKSIKVSKENIDKTFKLISNYSIYAFEEEIRNGFITLKGGHRVGIAGKVIYKDHGIDTIRDISSLNIRIAREKKGVSEHILKYIISMVNKKIYNTLIISPPQCGKTTLLRDIIRNLSNGFHLLDKGFKIGVIDERSELAGMYNGVPQHDIGIRTDVLDGCNKKDGTNMLLRAMSPDIIAMDEIGSISDIEAIHESLKAGVNILATVHGNNIQDLISRHSLKILIEERIFERYIFLDNSRGVGTVKDILEGKKFTSIM
ncbi:stage III sporulation protein AA [Keratinibaculum paraultunense]|uniref:Stage III sporulation protein AA n=1 Tax=Keratinibaculum paraultunense TaxID=1278232 RepID=A0A4R3KZ59_9FIRM|nr:stage III sporulation protein AA [Keratinibaculum paraultunense]QQY80606.1 stage III sporulation protein AA [Keratinibaculum paraultunense]TCS91336.1 stage III sporulation protein AA [Keratinibaculum paraultunense]